MIPVPPKINEAANAVSESLDALVVLYSGTINAKGFGALLKTLEPSEQQPLRPNAVVILTTFGGDASQAYRIARLLQNLTDKFYLCVPSQCKSAGTLIALGASEIYMPIVSELGPLDVQLRQRDEIGQQRSGMVVRTALDGLGDEVFKVFSRVMLGITMGSGQSISFDVSSRIASKIATGVMAPVYAQIDPQSLGNDLRDLSVATEYGNRLVEHGRNATTETVRHLVEDYPAHEFIIDREEAKKIFRTVNDLTEEMNALILELGETAYSVQSPQRICRLDGDHTHRDEDKEHGEDTEGSAVTGTVTGVDKGRKSEGRSDHKGERKAKEQT